MQRRNPLHFAIFNRHIEVIRCLLSKGTNAEIIDDVSYIFLKKNPYFKLIISFRNLLYWQLSCLLMLK